MIARLPAESDEITAPKLGPGREAGLDVNLDRRQLFTMFGALYFVQGVIQAYQLSGIG